MCRLVHLPSGIVEYPSHCSVDHRVCTIDGVGSSQPVLVPETHTHKDIGQDHHSQEVDVVQIVLESRRFGDHPGIHDTDRAVGQAEDTRLVDVQGSQDQSIHTHVHQHHRRVQIVQERVASKAP